MRCAILGISLYRPHYDLLINRYQTDTDRRQRWLIIGVLIFGPIKIDFSLQNYQSSEREIILTCHAKMWRHLKQWKFFVIYRTLSLFIMLILNLRCSCKHLLSLLQGQTGIIANQNTETTGVIIQRCAPLLITKSATIQLPFTTS